jgi:hypothetical protein
MVFSKKCLKYQHLEKNVGQLKQAPAEKLGLGRIAIRPVRLFQT